MTPRQDAPSDDAADASTGEHQPQEIIAGKYLLKHVLGIGGMGTVWAATNLDLDLDVAIKVVNKGLCSDETRARLATEARAEAKVQHRGIVRVLDLGVTSQGEPFLVMERLQGRSLGDLLDEIGHLDSKDAVRLLLPVLDALAYVHERGIVHRDLKPDNVFLAEQCGKIQPKLVDFGIAKLGDVPVNRRHTGRGAVVGSPGYMAPEHARGAEVDHRADIFCASLVLYEAISGRAAFRGANYNELLRAVIEQELPPITSYGRGDPGLSRILQRGLAKQPAQRQASCRELGRELATWLMKQGETEDITGESLSPWLTLPTTDEADTGPVTPAMALVRASRSRISNKQRSGLSSLRGVSISTGGLRPPRSMARRLAFVALAVSGFAGGFAATTALDLMPGQTRPRQETRVASAAPKAERRAAVQHPDAPIVTPVEPAPKPEPVKVVQNDPPKVRPQHDGVATRPLNDTKPFDAVDRSTPFPVLRPPPTFGDDPPAPRPASTSTDVHATRSDTQFPPTPPPDASASAEPEASKPTLTLPPDPPPARRGARAPGDDELKDPYQ